MRSKSARCSSTLSANSLIGIMAVASVVAPAAASAMTVVPASKGGAPSITDNLLWYAGYYTGSTANPPQANGFVFDDDTGSLGYAFGSSDLAQSQSFESASLANALSFTVTPSTTISIPSTGGTPVLMITVNSSVGGGQAWPVAIAGNAGSACAINGNCVTNLPVYNKNDPFPAPSGFGTYYYAIPFSIGGGPFTVQLYPRDVCQSFYALSNSTQAVGCGSPPNVAPALTSTVLLGAGAATMQLTFQVQFLVNGAINGVNGTALPSAADSATVNIRFEDQNRIATTGGTLSCPSSPVSYRPGDGKITADMSIFNPTTQQTPGGYAPISTAIAVGKKNSGAPTLGNGFLTGNDLVSRTTVGADVQFGGFSNLTAANDAVDTYNVGFLVRDPAGVVYTPAASGSVPAGCVLTGVQTSTIQGFLSQSSCFIATAAFRSVDASPVTLLREFRDQVLFKSDLGTSFVHWYYRWSPPAAEWLMKNPELRIPILEALVPVEVAAWFVLHPIQLTLLLVFSISSLVLGLIFAFVMRAKGRIQQ